MESKTLIDESTKLLFEEYRKQTKELKISQPLRIRAEWIFNHLNKVDWSWDARAEAIQYLDEKIRLSDGFKTKVPSEKGLLNR